MGASLGRHSPEGGASRPAAARPPEIRISSLPGGRVVAERARVASSMWSRFRGLMGRPEFPLGEGLWLLGDKSIHMMFVRFPIDAVFLARADVLRRAWGDDAGAGDREQTWCVVEIRRGLAPWRGVVWWVRRAEGCLELPAGTVESVGLAEGDLLRFEPA